MRYIGIAGSFNAMERGRLSGLDTLRGIAALMVLFYHTELIFESRSAVFFRSYLAVDFFFVLSGFLMARTYEADGRFRLSTAKFFVMRYRRLWPPLAVAAVLAVVAQSLPGSEHPQIGSIEWILSAILLVALVPNPFAAARTGSFYPGNGPVWSVYFELIANALHAALLHRLKTPVLLAIVIIALTASQWLWPGFDLDPQDIFTRGFPRAIAAYTLGIALFRFHGPVNIPPWTAIVALPGIIVFLGVAGIHPYADVGFVLVCPAIIQVALGARQSRMGDILGALSFPIYAVHMPVLLLVHQAKGGQAIGIALSLIAALAIALAVDRRLLRILRTGEPKPQTAVQTIAPIISGSTQESGSS